MSNDFSRRYLGIVGHALADCCLFSGFSVCLLTVHISAAHLFVEQELLVVTGIFNAHCVLYYTSIAILWGSSSPKIKQ